MNQPGDAKDSPFRDLYLALGSNQGARGAILARAVDTIRSWPELTEFESSPVYESAYVGPFGPQDPYLNLCVRLRSTLGPRELLGRAQELERRAGRDPQGHQRPRTLDIDLLLYGDREIDEPDLGIPHPRLRERRFVLQPLHDLAPGLRLPPDGMPVAVLLARFAADDQPLRRWEVLT